MYRSTDRFTCTSTTRSDPTRRIAPEHLPHSQNMVNLTLLATELDAFFHVNELAPDPTFSQLLPQVYDEVGFDWRRSFEPEFVNRFNGLMLRGADEVHTVFCAVLPTPQVLRDFLARARPGDLFFTHHPLDFEMGDPHGQPGRGPLPIEAELLDALKARQLSFYSCHAPLDDNRQVGTTVAIEQALGAAFERRFYASHQMHFGSIGTLRAISTYALMEKLKRIFDVPYVDLVGVAHDRIERIAVVAGSADKVEVMQEAEALGAQALISGEVRSHRGDEYGRAKFKRVMEYLPKTSMSLIGVSHAASEHLVMETQMAPWLTGRFQVRAQTIRMDRWWR